MKNESIQRDRLGPNPSKIRTNYVLAYMSIGASGFYLKSAKETVPNADQEMVE
jgi:thiamine transporter ThiT